MADTNLISDQKYQRCIWGYIPLDIHPWMDQFNAEYFWFRAIQCSTQGKLNGGWRTEFHTKALHESKMKVGRIYFTIILNDGSKTQAVVQKIIHRVFSACVSQESSLGGSIEQSSWRCNFRITRSFTQYKINAILEMFLAYINLQYLYIAPIKPLLCPLFEYTVLYKV